MGGFSRRRIGSFWQLALAALPAWWLFSMAGCAPAEAPPAEASTRSEPPATPVAAPVTSAPKVEASPANGKASETWDAYFLQGERAGYAQVAERPTERAGRELVEIEMINELRIQRFGQSMSQLVKMTSLETPDGEFLELNSETKAGPQAIVVAARVDGDKLIVDSGQPGSMKSTTRPWDRSVGGLQAIERSLREQPLRPGEERTVRLIMPLLSEVMVVENHLKAVDFESTPLLNGAYELLRIESQVELPGGQTIDSILWTDRSGETLKSSMPALGMDSFRTTSEVALEKAPPAKFDLGMDTFVRLSKPLERPHTAESATYRVRLATGDPAALFVSGPTQAIRSVDPHTAAVTVRARRADDGGEPATDDSVSPGDREPNALIQSDDEAVKELAEQARGEESDEARLAAALERFVNATIEEKNFSQGFATAADVARSKEGDCTEHAMLLAALARNCGIPARVVVGLVYIPSEQAFGYHMWDELFVGGRWIPYDATLGRGGIGAGHLKLAHTNLSEGSAVASLMPVIQVIGQLEIEPVDEPTAAN